MSYYSSEFSTKRMNESNPFNNMRMVNGFYARNLWRMRTLVEQYQESKLILPPLVAEIPCTHNIIIIEKCKDEHTA